SAPVVAHFGATAPPSLVFSSNYTLRVLERDGTQLFNTSPRGVQSVDPIAVDLDDDGSDEVVLLRHFPSELRVYRGDGTPAPGEWPHAINDLPDAAPIFGPVLPGGGRAILVHTTNGFVMVGAASETLGTLERRGF